MVKIFVVDDEEIIRDEIRNCIEKAQPECQFCGEAPDGEMALPLLQELKPDVLITDIGMPFMNGLELSAIVRKTMPWVHIVILSRLDAFEYAQRAVSLRVDAYLLKPANTEKLLGTLHDISRRIEKEKRSYLLKTQQRERAEQDKNILREHFLSRLVVGSVSVGEALEYGREEGLHLIAKRYMVCQAELAAVSGDWHNNIRVLAEQLFGERQDILWFLKGADRFVFIVKGDTDEMVQETAYETAKMLRHEIERYLSIDLSIGIGSLVRRLGDLARSYTDARSVTDAGLRLRGEKIIGYADVQTFRISPRLDLAAMGTLEEKLRHAVPEDISRIVEEHFKSAEKDDVQSVLFRYYLLMDLVVTAARVLADMGEPIQTIFARADNPQEILQVAESQQETDRFAICLLEKVVQQVQQCGTLRYGQEIRHAKEYIKENFADASISLHTIAAEVGFSPNHFSAIFSQETGGTFLEYLTGCRVDAAKQLLRDTHHKLADISILVGYNEPHYFSYLFKKQTGTTPSEYRSQTASAG